MSRISLSAYRMNKAAITGPAQDRPSPFNDIVANREVLETGSNLGLYRVPSSDPSTSATEALCSLLSRLMSRAYSQPPLQVATQKLEGLEALLKQCGDDPTNPQLLSDWFFAEGAKNYGKKGIIRVLIFVRAWAGALRGEGNEPEKHNIDASEKLARKAFAACMCSFTAVNRVLHKLSEGAEKPDARDAQSEMLKAVKETLPRLLEAIAGSGGDKPRCRNLHPVELTRFKQVVASWGKYGFLAPAAVSEAEELLAALDYDTATVEYDSRNNSRSQQHVAWNLYSRNSQLDSSPLGSSSSPADLTSRSMMSSPGNTETDRKAKIETTLRELFSRNVKTPGSWWGGAFEGGGIFREGPEGHWSLPLRRLSDGAPRQRRQGRGLSGVNGHHRDEVRDESEAATVIASERESGFSEKDPQNAPTVKAEELEEDSDEPMEDVASESESAQSTPLTVPSEASPNPVLSSPAKIPSAAPAVTPLVKPGLKLEPREEKTSDVPVNSGKDNGAGDAEAPTTKEGPGEKMAQVSEEGQNKSSGTESGATASDADKKPPEQSSDGNAPDKETVKLSQEEERRRRKEEVRRQGKLKGKEREAEKEAQRKQREKQREALIAEQRRKKEEMAKAAREAKARAEELAHQKELRAEKERARERVQQRESMREQQRERERHRQSASGREADEDRRVSRERERDQDRPRDRDREKEKRDRMKDRGKSREDKEKERDHKEHKSQASERGSDARDRGAESRRHQHSHHDEERLKAREVDRMDIAEVSLEGRKHHRERERERDRVKSRELERVDGGEREDVRRRVIRDESESRERPRPRDREEEREELLEKGRDMPRGEASDGRRGEMTRSLEDGMRRELDSKDRKAERAERRKRKSGLDVDSGKGADRHGLSALEDRDRDREADRERDHKQKKKKNKKEKKDKREHRHSARPTNEENPSHGLRRSRQHAREDSMDFGARDPSGSRPELVRRTEVNFYGTGQDYELLASNGLERRTDPPRRDSSLSRHDSEISSRGTLVPSGREDRRVGRAEESSSASVRHKRSGSPAHGSSDKRRRGSGGRSLDGEGDKERERDRARDRERERDLLSEGLVQRSAPPSASMSLPGMDVYGPVESPMLDPELRGPSSRRGSDDYSSFAAHPKRKSSGNSNSSRRGRSPTKRESLHSGTHVADEVEARRRRDGITRDESRDGGRQRPGGSPGRRTPLLPPSLAKYGPRNESEDLLAGRMDRRGGSASRPGEKLRDPPTRREEPPFRQSSSSNLSVRSHRRSPERDRPQLPLQKGGSMRWRSRSPVSSYDGREGEPPRGRGEPPPIPPDANSPMMRMPVHFPPGGMPIPPLGLPPAPFDVGLGPGHAPGMPGPLHDPVVMERLRREREEREGFEHRRRVEREERRGRSEGNWRGGQREVRPSMEDIRGGEGRRSPARDEDATEAPEEEEPEEGELVIDSLNTQVSPAASTSSKRTSPRSSRWGDVEEDKMPRGGNMDSIAAAALSAVLPEACEAAQGDDGRVRAKGASSSQRGRRWEEGACQDDGPDAVDGEGRTKSVKIDENGEEKRRDDPGYAEGDREIPLGKVQNASDDGIARKVSWSQAIDNGGRGGGPFDFEDVERGSRNKTGRESCGKMFVPGDGEGTRGDPRGSENASKRDVKAPSPAELSEPPPKKVRGQPELDGEVSRARSPSREERNGGAKTRGKVHDGEARASPLKLETNDSTAPSMSSKGGSKTETKSWSASGRRLKEGEGSGDSACESLSSRDKSQRSDPGISRSSSLKVGVMTPKGNGGEKVESKDPALAQSGANRTIDSRGEDHADRDARATGRHERLQQRADEAHAGVGDNYHRQDVPEHARAKKVDAKRGMLETAKETSQDMRSPGEPRPSSIHEGASRDGGIRGSDGPHRRSNNGDVASSLEKNHGKKGAETTSTRDPSKYPNLGSASRSVSESGTDAEAQTSERPSDGSPRGSKAEASTEGTGVRR